MYSAVTPCILYLQLRNRSIEQQKVTQSRFSSVALSSREAASRPVSAMCATDPFDHITLLSSPSLLCNNLNAMKDMILYCHDNQVGLCQFCNLSCGNTRVSA